MTHGCGGRRGLDRASSRRAQLAAKASPGCDSGSDRKTALSAFTDASGQVCGEDLAGETSEEGRPVSGNGLVEVFSLSSVGAVGASWRSLVVTRLARHGFVSLRQERVDRDPFDAAPFAATPAEIDRRLTPEQTRALERLRAIANARRFRVALLYGVTGSGKTEVYLRLSAGVRAAGRRVLMLVPEIALTPAVVREARRRDRVLPRILLRIHVILDVLDVLAALEHQHLQSLLGELLGRPATRDA